MAKLTPKQRKLASLLMKGGLTKVEAFKQAYKTSQTGRNLYASASRAASHPKVQAVIQYYHQAEWEGTIADAPEMRRLSLRVLREVAEHGKSEGERRKAAESIGKTNLAGLYGSGPSSIHNHLHIGGGVAREALIAKLTAMFGPPPQVAAGISCDELRAAGIGEEGGKRDPHPL